MAEFKLTPIEKNGQRVLTTAQLAKAYGTDSKTISYNFNHNKEHYIEGVHYYCLKGEELKAIREIHELPKNLNTLYLWTERGALLHAKSLNTDKAWEVYEFLVDTYFRTREMNNFYNEQIYQQLKVLEQKIDALEKNSVDRTNSIIKNIQKSISENAYGVVQTLTPCFEVMYKKLIKLYNKLIK